MGRIVAEKTNYKLCIIDAGNENETLISLTSALWKSGLVQQNWKIWHKFTDNEAPSSYYTLMPCPSNPCKNSRWASRLGVARITFSLQKKKLPDVIIAIIAVSAKQYFCKVDRHYIWGVGCHFRKTQFDIHGIVAHGSCIAHFTLKSGRMK